jgi:hypothetical protein
MRSFVCMGFRKIRMSHAFRALENHRGIHPTSILPFGPVQDYSAPPVVTTAASKMSRSHCANTRTRDDN